MRENIASGSPLEAEIGFSQRARLSPRITVSPRVGRGELEIFLAEAYIWGPWSQSGGPQPDCVPASVSAHAPSGACLKIHVLTCIAAK